MCRLVSYNVANLNSKLKFSNFFNYINNFDIFFLFETHVTVDKRNHFSRFFNDYVLYWIDAVKIHNAGRASGGCLFGFKKNKQKAYSLNFICVRGNIALSIKLGEESFYLIPRYLNCNRWTEDFEEFEDFIINLNTSNFCLLGDLNARVSHCQALDKNLVSLYPLIKSERTSKDNIIDSKGRKILDFLENIGGIILNGRHSGDSNGDFTFCGAVGNSVIDYCISSFSFLDFITEFSIPTREFSDHLPLEVNFSAPFLPNNVPSMLPPKLLWNPMNANKYYNALCADSSVEYLSGDFSADKKILTLLEKIKLAAGNFCSKKFFEPRCKWFDTECATARKNMLNKLNLLRKFNLEVYRKNYLASRKNYAKLCKKKKLLLKKKNIDRLNVVQNAGDWWKLANKMKHSTPQFGNSLSSVEFCQYFQSLLSSDHNLQMISWSMPASVDPFMDSPFELRDIILVLKRCKPNKAPGLDRVTYEFYKNAPLSFLDEVLQILNKIFLKNEIPTSFRKSIIVPLFKKGDPNSVENYRGLSLLDTLYKIFTGMILDRIHSWIDLNHILNEYQAGFRKGYSTVDNIFNLSCIVHLQRKFKQKTFAFFVDFSCAFDTIPRNSLFYKLSVLGLSSKIINILKSLYFETTSHVWDRVSLSESFISKQGVKQGCLLSPVLFSLYLNDLHDSLPGGIQVGDTKVKVLMYADDIVLLAKSPEELQNMIDALYDYCNIWGLTVNLAKSKIIIFREGSRISKSLNFSYGEKKIELVNEYKYLGVLLTYNLSYHKHLELKLATAKTAINATWLSYIFNPEISTANKLKIFYAASRSIMFYGAQVWGFKQYEQVEKLFRFFIKKLLFLPKNTPNYMIHIETGLQTQYFFTLRLHLSYIRKVFNLPTYRLPLILAKEVLAQEIYWVQDWKKLHLELQIAMPQDFSPSVLDVHFDNLLKGFEHFEHQQHIVSARNSQHHDLYPQLSYDSVSYFTEPKSAYVVSLIFKARCGLLDINARAFRNVAPGPCSICNRGEIENTYHLIGVCPIFSNTRLKILGKTELTISEVIDLLNKCYTKALCEFLSRSLKYRELIIKEFN